ncbi:hypothetical protein GIB67_042466 [Kingdonia uniflora]|uniref:Uncharacterized protein n=1 Tax=Kingdonia uniflora TaxID=39325 RepID=A0A7J7M0Y2_9MAGN|nr:hypothetical protein GIB67_042466 [Kingdonia uniflora]
MGYRLAIVTVNLGRHGFGLNSGASVYQLSSVPDRAFPRLDLRPGPLQPASCSTVCLQSIPVVEVSLTCSYFAVVLDPRSLSVRGLGIPEPRSSKEKFVTIDDVKHMKRIRIIKGGLLDFGFRSYENVYMIIEKGTNSCIIRGTALFEADEDKFEVNASRIKVDSLWGLSKAVANYVMQKREGV